MHATPPKQEVQQGHDLTPLPVLHNWYYYQLSIGWNRILMSKMLASASNSGEPFRTENFIPSTFKMLKRETPKKDLLALNAIQFLNYINMFIRDSEQWRLQEGSYGTLEACCDSKVQTRSSPDQS